ncbi:MAG TPA: response regulator transcription factor [Rhizomicrobium sp.]|nr:response regulator transcription factor [Rhizomicrobium sp.]
MAKTVLLYAIALALAAAGLEWVQYNYLIRAFSTDVYIALLAVAFVGLGIWAGGYLRPARPGGPFQRNDAALRSLGLTARECEILGLLAAGQSNKEMARQLDISPNTVKTHIASLYQKLEVQRRTQAVDKARELSLIA